MTMGIQIRDQTPVGGQRRGPVPNSDRAEGGEIGTASPQAIGQHATREPCDATAVMPILMLVKGGLVFVAVPRPGVVIGRRQWRYVYTVLRIALGRAYKLGKVARNVATLIDPPPKAPREIRPLTRNQVHVFLDAVREDQLGMLYTVAVATGMRQGELLALRWKDVDLEAGTLTVRHTLQAQTRELGQPETERSRRTLQLPAIAQSALAEQRKRQATDGIASMYVFASAAETPPEVATSRDDSSRRPSRWDSPASDSTTSDTRLPRYSSRPARSSASFLAC